MNIRRRVIKEVFNAEVAKQKDQYYAQALIDIVKCFEMISHKAIVMAAIE